MGSLATFRTKCQVQVQVQGQARGGGGGRQAFSRRLCSWRESLLSLLRAGPGQRPRPAPWCPTGAASSRPRGACPLVPAPPLRATEGSGYSGRGEARSGSVGASPAPQSQQQTERCRTDARAEGPNPARSDGYGVDMLDYSSDEVPGSDM
ncbi:uncharacterized protein LOC106510141 [Sus scrofa]|uniref:uncharacterized protein LOC106510141 n=1 Tax=Sus scrofa TaxID=9823 RepID=UPI000A2B0BA9|nr:uncharacterized protein LOC106510141 [Sus scrofa]